MAALMEIYSYSFGEYSNLQLMRVIGPQEIIPKFCCYLSGLMLIVAFT